MILFSVGRGSGSGGYIVLSTGALVRISVLFAVAVAVDLTIIVLLCKLLLEEIKKRLINIFLPNAGACVFLVVIQCWRISIHQGKSRDRRRLNRAILRKIEDAETEQVCL